jgi:hypothetical protein
MKNEKTIKDDSLFIQCHLSFIQQIIQRMSINCASSKTYCITIVSAILLVIADKGKLGYIYIAFIPIIIFLLLDSYYLALEKGFRNSYNIFINNIHNDEVSHKDLFVLKPSGNILTLFGRALISFSVWPFYLAMLLVLFIIKICFF